MLVAASSLHSISEEQEKGREEKKKKKKGSIWGETHNLLSRTAAQRRDRGGKVRGGKGRKRRGKKERRVIELGAF